jgi:hypothetical protein
MPYAGTCKLWKGWVGVTGNAAFNISIFKYTPVPDDATPDSLVLVKEFSGTALNNNSKLIAIDLTTGFYIALSCWRHTNNWYIMCLGCNSIFH